MAKVLIRFWLGRFALVFAIAAIALGAVERVLRGAAADYGSVVAWSAAAAVLAASLTTWWSWKRTCAVRPPRS